MDSLSCLPLNTSFYMEKHEKRLPENPEYAEMSHGDVLFNITMTSQIDVRPAWGSSAAVCFLFFSRAGTGM